MKNILKKISMTVAVLLAACSVALAPVQSVFASGSGSCDNPQSLSDCKHCGSASKNAQCAAKAGDPDGGNGDDLTTSIQKIINAVLVVMGIVAVVFIIMGGVSYATSQGDPSKAAKAKNTILYAIVGLIVCLLAFAIVNFVLDQLA